MKSLVLIIIITFYSTWCFGGNGSGKISRIYAHEKNNGDGVIMFAVEIHENPPEACPGHEWAFDASTNTGKAMYSLLISAAIQKTPVVINGAGDCGAWHDRERPIWIKVEYGQW
ncbi:hypothetical protein [Alteromonas lipotrueae]|uniref:hypothetical protein n=1 Tax=Alteromonas lipotrueae TaxID=2803814 RepID=UPI001C47D9C3|nr:hypothetical protein [Alteromonas lipotrueae]